ncbi:MAG TPA: hypothetical protein GX509_10520 [Firmicutes bacterium]|nr:hypothetical protein [Bacillota bacterium]HHY99159.1 hypothetical protein [Bacillota bacterium]
MPLDVISLPLADALSVISKIGLNVHVSVTSPPPDRGRHDGRANVKSVYRVVRQHIDSDHVALIVASSPESIIR